jgi:hypothetical protein
MFFEAGKWRRLRVAAACLRVDVPGGRRGPGGAGTGEDRGSPRLPGCG